MMSAFSIARKRIARICQTPLRTLCTLPLVVFSVLSLLFAVAFLRLGEEVREAETLRADQTLLRAITTTTASWSVVAAADASLLGSEIVVASVTVLLAGALAWRRHFRDACFIAIAIGGSALLTLVVKRLVERGRPIAFFRVAESGYSFPSGHTLSATCLTLALGFLVWRSGARRALKMVGSVLLAVAVAVVAMSRLVLGVHYPTDVLGSALLGVAWMTALIALYLGAVEWQRMHAHHAPEAAAISS